MGRLNGRDDVRVGVDRSYNSGSKRRLAVVACHGQKNKSAEQRWFTTRHFELELEGRAGTMGKAQRVCGLFFMGPDRPVHNLRGRVTAAWTVVMEFCSGIDLLLGPVRVLLTFRRRGSKFKSCIGARRSTHRCLSLARSPALERGMVGLAAHPRFLGMSLTMARVVPQSRCLQMCPWRFRCCCQFGLRCQRTSGVS